MNRALGAALIIAALPGWALSAQQVDPPPAPADSGSLIQVVPGPEYEADGLHRLLMGDNRRDLWLRELTVPLLDLGRFAGGLRPIRQCGNQSKKLHMRGADGRGYIFRSVNKHLAQVFPEDLRGTWVEAIAQDHVSIFHPGGPFVVPRLHQALDQLPVPPVYRVMPDAPRLGEFRETFAGMLGTVVEWPNEGEHGEALVAGSHRVVGTDELFDKLEDNPRHRVAAEEFLAARLVDFLVGDTDRGPDQWRWARTPAEGGFLWRPVIRDRDWALMNADGVVPWLVGQFYPKLVTFEDEIPAVERLTWADVGMGRRLLAELDAAAFDSVAATVVTRLSDRVINEAVIALPAEQKPGHAGEVARTLKARRGWLLDRAREWYARLSTDVDVHGTDLPDRAEVVRRPDGRVEVTLFAPAAAMVPVRAGDPADEEEAAENAADPYYDPYREGYDPSAGVRHWSPHYHRVFLPDETDEVRIYLQGGDDTAVVRGEGPGEIRVRLIGGGGTDQLHDWGRPSGATALYDDDDDTRIVPGRRTHVDRRRFRPPEGSERFLVHKLGYDRHRDWGSHLTPFAPELDYREGAGVIVGGGPIWADYRFRSVPFGLQGTATVLVSTLTGKVGLEATGVVRLQGSPAYGRIRFRATPFEATRFYGYGNGTPLLDGDRALIFQDRLLMEAMLGSRDESWRLEFGPLLRYFDPDVPEGNPAEDLPGSEIVTSIGAALRFRLERMADTVDRKGVRFDVEAGVYPDPEGDAGPYVTTDAALRGYLPVPFLRGAGLAARTGVRWSLGHYPIHDAATVGGGSTLRGFRWQRFAGDVAAYGGAELRVPLFRANLLLVRGKLGILGFMDAGRVWVDGDSPGGWHTGYGTGLFFRTLDTAVYAAWAHGEENRIYLGLGLPF